MMLTAIGAARLADTINAYWHSRGFDPQARAIEIHPGYMPVIRSASLHIVVSNMRNAWPTKRLEGWQPYR